ncbi:TPA: AbrB/MazE/SpoVT family DNA-binding domain-containing protein [Candidatus Woesearchaeota archaeon]|nr:AbrB/MazE/SpoVT family DNA-binding domain-containing protein [Candidatus Woesearchaeota archaeon]
MIECESIARKWGSSIGITIPSEVVEKAKIKENRKIRFIIIEEDTPAKRTFGLLKGWKKPTPEIIKEMREGNWDE